MIHLIEIFISPTSQFKESQTREVFNDISFDLLMRCKALKKNDGICLIKSKE